MFTQVNPSGSSVVVLCCLFLCQCFGDVSPYVCSYLLLLSGHLWERAAHSVDHINGSLCTSTICYLVFSRFGFEGGIWFLIAPVPVLYKSGI